MNDFKENIYLLLLWKPTLRMENLIQSSLELEAVLVYLKARLQQQQ